MITKIKNLEEIFPNHSGYGVILSEHYPEVVFEKNAIACPVESYLWYPIKLEQIPNTFTEYFREKLAITDPAESVNLIDT